MSQEVKFRKNKSSKPDSIRVKSADDDVEVVPVGDSREILPETLDGDKSSVLNKLSVSYASSQDSAPHRYGGDATATSEVDTSHNLDKRSLIEHNAKIVANSNSSEKLYMGTNAYSMYQSVDKANVGNNKHTGTQGPVRAPNNIRSTTRVDYALDICKDFHDTGYCGFGDSCKFVHDRGDYKAGWQIELEYKQELERRRVKLMAGHDSDDVKETMVDEVGDVCCSCNKPLDDDDDADVGYLTLCGHMYCSSCLYPSSTMLVSCVACNRPLDGIANTRKTKKRKKKAIIE